MSEAGTLWLLLTGGEIFLRPDFFDIYEHAVQSGLLITLFTNATLITEEIADRLADVPPRRIEVTLYGTSRETYEKVTGVSGSWARCYRGVELLLERRLPLGLKTVVMKSNQHEFMDLLRFAESRGVPFRWDTNINPNLNHSLSPSAVRISPQEAADINLSIARRAGEIRKLFEPRRDFCTSELFACGAGSRVFHVDPYGNMAMCLLLREPAFSLREMSFVEIWNEMFAPLSRRKRRRDHVCNGCTYITLCGKCPGWSLLEEGDIEALVEWSCELGHRLARKLGFYKGSVRHSPQSEEEGDELPVPDRETRAPVVVQAGGCR